MSEAKRRAISPQHRVTLDASEPLLPYDEHDDPRGIKRKQPTKSRSFKVIGHMVLAMQRFQASLNPTYTYGKRPSISAQGHSVPEGSDGAGRTPTRSSSAEPGDPTTSQPVEQYVYSSHGHKADYLFKSLPEPTPPVSAGG